MKPPAPESDPFNLARFVHGQQHSYEIAVAELRRGKKENHWMWYIFPQLDGLGISAQSKRYAIRSLAEATAYLNHPVLGPRLTECCGAILSVQGKSALEILGFPDDMKLKSSMTLFSLVPDASPVFRNVLDQYFGGKPDPITLELLKTRR